MKLKVDVPHVRTTTNRNEHQGSGKQRTMEEATHIAHQSRGTLSPLNVGEALSASISTMVRCILGGVHSGSGIPTVPERARKFGGTQSTSGPRASAAEETESQRDQREMTAGTLLGVQILGERRSPDHWSKSVIAYTGSAPAEIGCFIAPILLQAPSSRITVVNPDRTPYRNNRMTLLEAHYGYVSPPRVDPEFWSWSRVTQASVEFVKRHENG
ncbi:hypothetical protein K438DRAFT_1779724 [Mycena galopus ATCC 62051]|nr:hypothetical protein K438DRAFT_1779724 [Mycena galopus ATCC 62051]